MPDKQAAQGQPSVSAAGTPPAKGKGAGKGAETPTGKEFVNRFGLPTATALVVGSIIGTGVFALPSAGPLQAVQPARLRPGDDRRAGAGAGIRLAQQAGARLGRPLPVRAWCC